MARGVEYKSLDDIRAMRRAGLVVAEVHQALRAAAKPGVTTAELDDISAATIADAGATSNFYGYHGFPATVCISVNEEIVHGIPGPRVLEPGDVVSFDCGAVVDGWHGDAAFTVVLGEESDVDPGDLALSRVTEEAMWDAIAALATGRKLDVVGAAVEDAVARAEAAGEGPYGIIEDYVGHGIGSEMHQPPDVLNYRTSQRAMKLRPGLCLAVEPMITRGGITSHTLADEWTVVTDDGSRAAHWEHTVAITDSGISVLTAPDGGAAELGRRGVDITKL
ncbi:MAG TPA: type I methionyl aminopeptidase [Actinomycetaceae bacterium]|nr:type I methionyl aminopeptidase [Actinomycetaceae bacterium]